MMDPFCSIDLKMYIPYFGPRNTSAPIILLPDAYFSPRYFSPEILQSGNTSARNHFGPTHFGPRAKFSKVSFLINLGLPWA